jgi:trehalose/maltose transport system substrate-binding protein
MPTAKPAPLILLCTLLVLVAPPPPAAAATLTLICGTNPEIHALCREAAEEWAAASGHQVRVAAQPAEVQDRLQVYQELLGVADPGLDVLEIDVTWPAVLGEDLVDLTPFLEGAEQGIAPVLLANNRVGGRLVALPWYVDFGVLYYRKDLLEAADIPVPEDWDALAEAALALQTARREAGNGRFWGFVWQGWRSEALVCNAMEWLAGSGAGRIVDADARVTLDNPGAVTALERPIEWLSSISPESVLSFTEDESLAVFAAGNAAFLRHWPGAWARLDASDSPLAGKVGIAPLPKLPEQARHPATLGGWQLAVSRHSRQPELAADLVRHLTSAQVQRRMALGVSVLPTRPVLYLDAEVQAALPVARLLAERRVELVPRPSSAAGARYPELSRLVQESVFDLLSGRGEPDEVVPRLARQLQRLVNPASQ